MSDKTDTETHMQLKPWIRASLVVLVGAMLARPVHAATIFGTLTQKGKPVAKAQLTLSCPGLASPAATQSDDRGAYHFSVATKGKCKLAVQSGAAKAETDVIVDPNPTQYDFEVDASTAAARLVRR
jgi:hypothetical protein